VLIGVPSTPLSFDPVVVHRRLHVPVVEEGGKMEGGPSLPVSYSYVHLGIDENPSYVTMPALTLCVEEKKFSCGQTLSTNE
jgi:hypothetical protein